MYYKALQKVGYHIFRYFGLCTELVTTGLSYSSYLQCYTGNLMEGEGERGALDTVEATYLLSKH